MILTYKGNTKEFEQGTYIHEVLKENFLNWLINSNKDSQLQRIYILRGGDYVKVGIANDMEQRLKKLQTGNPFKLEILFITDLINNAFDLELFILNKYKEKAMYGEWFKFSKEDIQNCIEFINFHKQ